MHVPVLVILCSSISLAIFVPPEKKVVCYHTSWSRYRQGLASFTPQNINPFLCTHIHYALANSNEDQQLGPADPFADFTKKGYAEFTALKEANPALKTVLMLGGSDTTQQEYFELMTTNQINLNRFVAEAIKYLQKHNFDGIDIDWQRPLADSHHADLIEALLAGFQAEADRSGGERLSVSTTLPTNFTLLRDSFDLARLSTVVDYMSLLTYRFHGSDAAVTGHHAPLHATDMQTTDYADFAVAACEELGADLGRLLLGVPTFGLTFTLEDAGADGYGAPALSAGRKGKYTKAVGTLSFYEICEHLSLDGWTAFRPKSDTLGPYAVSGDGQWVAYDDERMMRTKGRYARDRGLGGVAVWALAQDDFRGLCTGRPYPLVEAVKAALQPETQVPPTTQAPPTTPAYDNTPAFTCPGNGRFPKADDCTKFFICVERSSQAMSCPDGEQYDVGRQACSAEADCVERPLVGVTGFPPTPPPVGPQLPLPATPAPPAATPAPPAATPAPPAATPAPPAATPAPPPVAMPSPATQPPPTAPPRPPTPVAVPTASAAFDELQQILELIRRVGGLNVVRRQLEGASATSAIQPDADVTLSGSSRLRVTVTVDLQPL